MDQPHYTVTKDQQLKHLSERVPPVLSIDIVVWHDGKYLVGRRNTQKLKDEGKADLTYEAHWLFPGGRMRFDERLEEAANRILTTELPGVNAQLKRLIAAQSDMGADARAYGVTLYYLYEYISGEPRTNYQLDDFRWVTKDELLALPHASWLNQEIVGEIDVAVQMRNSTQDEVLVEVDADDREIGQILKRTANNSPDRYHRAAHLMMFTSDGQLILHQRAFTKASHPGAWDMFGGHQAYGMTIEQTARAELVEKLGSNAPLTFAYKDTYSTDNKAEWFYLYYGVDDGPYGFDRNEVQQIGFFDPQKLLDGGYDDDFEILKHVYRYTKDLRHVWEELQRSKRAIEKVKQPKLPQA